MRTSYVPGLLLTIIFILFSSSVWSAKSLTPIGKITKIRGFAVEQPKLLVSYDLGLNSPVHEGSEIKTGNNARMEITFNDGSKMTLGEWTTIKLEGYKFSDDNNFRNESQIINIVTGAFRYVSGLISKSNRYKVQLKTPVATIGIRGTDFYGGPLAAGMPPGEIHYGFMSIDGAIHVVNRHGITTLDEPNEGTFLPMTGHKAPTPASVWRQQAIDEAFASIEF